jgi:dethiobiotin synthetase
MKQAYFVTGTDTGIGKTTVSCLLLRAYAAQGLKAVGMKPVASGCQRVGGALVSEDVTNLQAASNVDAPLSLINPYAFEPPLAPHIAAAQAGADIQLAVIGDAFKQLQECADVVVVEGVGGFRVPLNAHEDTADLAIMLGLPVVLVVGLRLGCINHALLTYDALVHSGLSVAGWVANQVDADMAALEANIEALDKRLAAPCLGRVPFGSSMDWKNLRLPGPECPPTAAIGEILLDAKGLRFHNSRIIV